MKREGDIVVIDVGNRNCCLAVTVYGIKHSMWLHMYSASSFFLYLYGIENKVTLNT